MPPAPSSPSARQRLASPLLPPGSTSYAPPWREQLSLRGVAVAAALGTLLCVVIHRLNLTVGVIPALNVASGLLAFFLATAWRAAAKRLGFGSGKPFTRQENTVIQTCAIACAGLAFSGCSVSYIFAMDRKSYNLVGPDYPGNREQDIRDPALGWIISFMFLIALLGPFSIVMLGKVMVIDYKLTFPGGTATALMINSLHGKTEDLSEKKVHCLVKYMTISFGWSLFKWFFSGVGDSCGFDNFPTFGLEAFRDTFYFNFSPSYVGFGLISPHIVNCSVFLGSVISWGILWPFIRAQAGHWYPDNLSNSDFRGLYGYKVFIAIAIILGDGLYNLVKIFVVIGREFCSSQSIRLAIPAQALQESTRSSASPRAPPSGTCHAGRTACRPMADSRAPTTSLPSTSHMTPACISRRFSSAEVSSGGGGNRRLLSSVMETLTMLKVGYTILRSETPATDLVNAFMDWAAQRSLMLLAIFLPPYYVYKLIAAAFKAAAPEDVAGKVVLITGASSGIGEQIAYQYAKKGARLALAARREGSLHEVAAKAKDAGSPDVLVVAGDVSNPEDCQRFVQTTVDRFGQLDHLVNNAGVGAMCWFEEVPDVADFKQVMAVNFWGAVHPTHYALPHLKKSGGKIFVNSSAAAVLAMPRMSLYNASKAAVLNFFETLRIELRNQVGITVATPGWIESEMTKGKHLSKEGTVEVDQDTRDVGVFPVVRTERCAEAIVDGICRGRRHLTVPTWYRAMILWRKLVPEVADISQRLFYRRTAIGPVTSRPRPRGS